MYEKKITHVDKCLGMKTPSSSANVYVWRVFLELWHIVNTTHTHALVIVLIYNVYVVHDHSFKDEPLHCYDVCFARTWLKLVRSVRWAKYFSERRENVEENDTLYDRVRRFFYRKPVSRNTPPFTNFCSRLAVETLWANEPWRSDRLPTESPSLIVFYYNAAAVKRFCSWNSVHHVQNAR